MQGEAAVAAQLPVEGLHWQRRGVPEAALGRSTLTGAGCKRGGNRNGREEETVSHGKGA